MPEISLTNALGRDATVGAESVHPPVAVRLVDARGRQALGVRFLKAQIEHDYEALLEQAGSPAEVGKRLIQGDPEVDLETTGITLAETAKVYIDARRQVVHRVQEWELLFNPDGTVRDRRPRQLAPPNVSPQTPLRWTGKLVPRADAVRRFVFVLKLQLLHVNGLTYDFLFAMAKELESKDSLMVVGAGSKGTQPIILRRGGMPYRGFLEGRTQGERYCLLLHLSNLELKAPPPEAAP